MEIKGLNLTIRDGLLFVLTTDNVGGFGERSLLIGQKQDVLSHVKKSGAYVFGSPDEYNSGMFFALNKTLNRKTKNHKFICIGNAKNLIEQHITNGGKTNILAPAKQDENSHVNPIFQEILNTFNQH